MVKLINTCVLCVRLNNEREIKKDAVNIRLLAMHDEYLISIKFLMFLICVLLKHLKIRGKHLRLARRCLSCCALVFVWILR